MANPANRQFDQENLHPSIDSDFRDSQYDAKNIFPTNDNRAPKPFGVTNSAKEVRVNDYRSNQAPKKLPPKGTGFRYGKQNSPTSAKKNLKRLNKTTQPRINSPHLQPKKLLKPSPARQLARFARSIITGMAALSWTFWLWLTVQLPFGILSLILLGLWIYSEQSWWFGWIQKVVETVLKWFGYEIEVYSSLFMLSWILVTVAGLVAVFGVLLQFLFTFLRPVSGKMGGIKMALLCAIIICYLIPFLNLFPWIWIYIFMVMRYPK